MSDLGRETSVQQCTADHLYGRHLACIHTNQQREDLEREVERLQAQHAEREEYIDVLRAEHGKANALASSVSRGDSDGRRIAYLEAQHDALVAKLWDQEEMAKAMWNSHPAYQLDENGTRYLSWEDVKDTSASQSARNLSRVVLTYLGLDTTL
jgi:hypothetical protein